MSDLNGQPAGDVDGQRYAPRCKRHTIFMLENMQLGELWQKRGLVGDVIVRLLSLGAVY